jgi:hypothetical protein
MGEVDGGVREGDLLDVSFWIRVFDLFFKKYIYFLKIKLIFNTDF